VSTVGRTRTFPAPGAVVARLRLAYASCQRWEHGYYSAWRHMRDENLDLVMFLGDYIYEYPNAANAVRAPTGGWVVTLDDYRQRYALHRSDADLQAMHAACPWLVTWDDHEVQNDYAGLTQGNSGPPVENFAVRRAAGYQAFYEHMPLPVSVLTRAMAGLAAGADMRLYSRQPYGRLASLGMLDARQYKDAQVCTRDGKAGSSTLDPATCPAWDDPARSMLGRQQEGWLDAELARAASRESHWNVLGQQSLFGRRDFKRGPGQVFWNDGWDGYAPARTRLTDALQKHQVANPVLLGGDVHENWVGHVRADYADTASAAVGVEFCGTSITSRSAGNARIPEVLAENPHFLFADSERRGYGVAEFTPQRLTTTLRVVSDVTQQDSGIETLAQFSVEAGRPVIERR
ncbi:MAG: alkaline phosphatase D family protein, partial [Pseudomonadota bacterium]|nr:alkaline phosphatase D family protein [Pseudomonadota bacterium]